jgi:hypothetical protein
MFAYVGGYPQVSVSTQEEHMMPRMPTTYFGERMWREKSRDVLRKFTQSKVVITFNSVVLSNYSTVNCGISIFMGIIYGFKSRINAVSCHVRIMSISYHVSYQIVSYRERPRA